LAEDEALLFGDHEELESAAEAVAITDHGSKLGNVGRDGHREFERYDFSGHHATAQGRADAVEPQFAGPAPIGAGEAIAKDGDLNPDVEAVPGKAPQPFLGSFGRLGLVGQSGSPFRRVCAKSACNCLRLQANPDCPSRGASAQWHQSACTYEKLAAKTQA